ncbi:hypothetical protein [Chromobacterium sp. IIBBL 290-4]|uniref:hypothetical protein n=1 Tax=Chromobacterium sp. IIBBL 290-4 TaxID=2953890 RepID=UPI0020B8C448|nr:hypothetical protein [Chromobacterium sp. IIBBL 290-4]UTH73007.1 hypothetical protein NKT35_15870 [Chromobacterium sp. IIBBL 290-4]
MDVLHATWFWVVIIVAPALAVVGTLARLARREPPIKLPPGVRAQAWDDEEEDAPSGETGNGDREVAKH